MGDVHDKKTRSYNMSRIRHKDTKPEMLVRSFLHANGFRYTLHDKRLIGKPDLVLPKYKTVVFIHGCFWHGHSGCRYFVIPKTRTDWWKKKIEKNQSNDKTAILLLKKNGWKVIIVWECDLKKKKMEMTLLKIVKKISTNI